MSPAPRSPGAGSMSCLVSVMITIATVGALVLGTRLMPQLGSSATSTGLRATNTSMGALDLTLNRNSLPRASVALGIQCNILMLEQWRSLFSALPHEERRRFAVFLYIYGKGDIAGSIDDFLLSDAAGMLVAASTPSSKGSRSSAPRSEPPRDSWTTGRNALARLMYSDEVARGAQYSWWAMADGDMSRLTCKGCGVSFPNNSAAVSACCFLHASIAAESLPFASVATTPFAQDPPTPVHRLFHFSGRVDAQFQVFHRRAVPILLPYHDDLDAVSWFISQELVQMYSKYCLPGAVVGLMLTVRAAENTHSSYPRHKYSTANLTEVLRRRHPAIAQRFLDGSGTGACRPPPTPAPSPASGYRQVWYPEDVVRWQESPEFACCLSERGPHFVSVIGGGVPEAPQAR